MLAGFPPQARFPPGSLHGLGARAAMMAALALRRLLRALVAGNPAARARMLEVMERRYEDARG